MCLIGANGAGKTTTLKGICGLLAIKSGTIRYAGENVTGRPAFELVRRGLAMVPEGRGVFGALTIEENLAMGAYVRTDNAGIRADVERVFELFPRLKERRRQTAGTLSGGEQQMLAMGRALMSKPTLLLLDEPSMGLAPLMVQKVFETVLAVAKEGVTILLIEQNAKLALEVSRPRLRDGIGRDHALGRREGVAARSRGARRVSRRSGLSAGCRTHRRFRARRPRRRPHICIPAWCPGGTRSRGTRKRCACSSARQRRGWDSRSLTLASELGLKALPGAAALAGEIVTPLVACGLVYAAAAADRRTPPSLGLAFAAFRAGAARSLRSSPRPVRHSPRRRSPRGGSPT